MQNYQSIYRDLLQQIRNGKLIPGLGLPGENSLAESYHVSRPTLRKALHLLADDGYVCCQPGVGRKVLRTSPVVPCDDLRITVGIDFGGEEWAMFYHEPFLRGMRKVAEVNHCALQLIDIDYKTGRISGEVDALALGKATKEHYPVLEKIAENIPIILFNRMPVEKKLAYISVDYRQASILPVEYLIRYGHRRIAVISQANSLVSQERVQGWRIALEENGISYSPDLIYSGNNISGLVDFLKTQKPTAEFDAIGV